MQCINDDWDFWSNFDVCDVNWIFLRQHLLTELKRVQEKEGELHKLQIELSRKMMLFEEKEKSIEKLITIRTDQKISEYDAQAGFQIDPFNFHSVFWLADKSISFN